jgi:hypothetical protein
LVKLCDHVMLCEYNIHDVAAVATSLISVDDPARGGMTYAVHRESSTWGSECYGVTQCQRSTTRRALAGVFSITMGGCNVGASQTSKEGPTAVDWVELSY